MRLPLAGRVPDGRVGLAIFVPLPNGLVRAGRKLPLPFSSHLGYPLTMKGPTVDTPKKRGRPFTGGRREGVMVRFEPDQLAALDAWIEGYPGDPPTRPEAIRMMINMALADRRRYPREEAP